MSCTKGGACKYSHDYILTPDQLATLAANAKKAPCNFLKNGMSIQLGLGASLILWSSQVSNAHTASGAAGVMYALTVRSVST
jgi:hypothetical protein